MRGVLYSWFGVGFVLAQAAQGRQARQGPSYASHCFFILVFEDATDGFGSESGPLYASAYYAPMYEIRAQLVLFCLRIYARFLSYFPVRR